MPGRWRALIALLAGAIMGPIDASIVNINLPVIAADLGVTPDRVGWVSMAYLLVLGSLLLPFGRLGDILGLKRVYLAGLLVFVATSATCALAGGLDTLVTFRALQALGAGMTMAMAPAIITAEKAKIREKTRIFSQRYQTHIHFPSVSLSRIRGKKTAPSGAE